MNEYKTIKNEASESITEKKSEFIGYVKPVNTEKDALRFIENVRADHRRARHVVYAYVLRENSTTRYSDAGEPRGTAGLPIMSMLLKEEIVDVAVVVVRYFGGVLLGTGGLVRAYTHAAQSALNIGGIAHMKLFDVGEVVCSYSMCEKVTHIICDNQGIVDDTRYEGIVSIRFHAYKSNAMRIKKEILNDFCECAKVQLTGEQYHDISS